MNSFYDFFKMIKEKKIRKGDVLEVVAESDGEILKDYYIVTDKDVRWLKDHFIYLWDNFFLFDLLEGWKFNVIYKENEKKEILERFGLSLDEVKSW